MYLTRRAATLNVLQKTGSDKERKWASKIIPIRKRGHLLLITLILGNMLVNEAFVLRQQRDFGC